MTTPQLATMTIKWLVIMFALAISFHLFGAGVLQTLFDIKLSQTGKNIGLGVAILLPLILATREISAGLKKGK